MHNNLCLNGGFCYPNARPNQVFCLCTEEYRGEHCEMKRVQIRLSIKGGGAHAELTIQCCQIDHVSLILNLDCQEVHRHFSRSLRYLHDAETVPEITLAQIFHSHHELPAASLDQRGLSFVLVSSLIGYHHSHVECFIFDDQRDRCLRGNHREPNDLLCLCPSCYSGRRFQFNSKSFAFTLDQLL